MKRTKEQAAKTREQILSAAESLFHRRGVSRPSLEDIAQEAGVTRGAIYWHFKNKHEVFAAMCGRVDLPFEAAFGSDCVKASRPLEKLTELIVDMLIDTAQDPQRKAVFEIIAYKCEMVDDHDDVAERRLNAYRHAVECVQNLLQQAVQAGELPEHTDVHFAATMVHAFITGTLTTWALQPECVDVQQDAQRIARVALAIPAQCRALPSQKGNPPSCDAPLEDQP